MGIEALTDFATERDGRLGRKARAPVDRKKPPVRRAAPARGLRNYVCSVTLVPSVQSCVAAQNEKVLVRLQLRPSWILQAAQEPSGLTLIGTSLL